MYVCMCLFVYVHVVSLISAELHERPNNKTKQTQKRQEVVLEKSAKEQEKKASDSVSYSSSSKILSRVGPEGIVQD